MLIKRDVKEAQIEDRISDFRLVYGSVGGAGTCGAESASTLLSN